MGKETDTPQGDASKEKNPPQTNLPRRSPRSERFKGEEVAAATPTPGPSSTTTTTTTTTEKRRLIATVTKNNSSSSGKCPSSSGRKLSALSAHKRALETPENGKGMERSSSKRQLNNNSTPQPANTPIEKAQTTEDSTPMRTGAPPMTVAEAQEVGEQARLRDDVMWALEGLSTGVGVAKQASLATLTEIYSVRRNRMALHTSSLGNDFLAGIAKVKVTDDPVLAHGTAAILLLSTQIGGDPMVFSREEIAKLATSIIESQSSLTPGTDILPPATRILRILHDANISKILPREASFNSAAVTLVALCTALDPHNCNVGMDDIKHSLRVGGVLKAVAQLAADQSLSVVEPSPTMETVQSLWQLERSLVVLEHSCFACTENESHLIDSHISQGVPPMVARIGLAQWMVHQVQALNRQAVIAGLKKDCLRGLLAVLMNMTHNNTTGCEKVIAVSGVETVVAVLSRICLGGVHVKGVLQSADELRAWLDELNGCLGLLINCAEEDKDNRVRMRALQVSSLDGGGTGGLVSMLSRLISSVMGEKSGGGNNEQGDGEGTAPSASQAEEVTLDALQQGDGEAAASIVEVYAAILLGFLIEGDTVAQGEAAELLPGKSLVPVIAAVQRCLNFYVNAGAVTQRTEASLRALLASLLGLAHTT